MKSSQYKFTKYEKSRLIGIRADQISKGAPSTVKIEGLDSALEIAEKEFFEDKIPLIILKTFPNGKKKEIPAYLK